MKKTILAMLILGLLILPGCKGGGDDGPNASEGVIALAPTVEGVAGPSDNTCEKYPDGAHTVTVNPRFVGDEGTICGLRLCWVCGDCFYACPAELLPDSCNH